MAAVYTEISINDPRLWHPAAGRRSMVTFGRTLLVPCSLAIPSLAFGDTALDDSFVQIPERSSEELTIEHAAVMDLRLADAVLHAPEGVVTIGEFVIAETYHEHLADLGYRRDGNRIRFPAPSGKLRFGSGLSALGLSYGNYYHFLLEIVPRLRVAPFDAARFEGVVVFPARLKGPQLEVAGLLGRAGTSMFLSEGRTAIHFEELWYSDMLLGGSFRPHPSMIQVFDSLRRALGVSAVPRNRIYVARRDTPNRRLANEAAVIELVLRHGFEVVELSGLSLAEQARLFAGASHIIAPHGAGLANIVFCAPGVSLCELHMDKYVMWCFRRLGGLVDMNYGCLVGRSNGGELMPDGQAHHLSWTAPLDRLEAVLADPRFTGRMPATAAAPAVVEEVALNRLFVPFESLGSNCEFGIVQREAGFDPPGLFRNAGFSSFDALLAGLDSNFDGLFEHGTAFTLQPGWRDWQLACDRHGFAFHTAIPSLIERDTDEWQRRTRQAIAAFRYMREKLLADLAEGEKKFVFRFWRNLDDPEIERLHRAIRRHGPGWLLYVREDPAKPPTWIEDRGDGLVIAAIDKLAHEEPITIDYAGWTRIARMIRRLRTGTASD